MGEPYTITQGANGKVRLTCNGAMCMRNMTHKTLEDAVLDWNNHTCPWGSGTKVAWSVTKTLVEQVWDKADHAVDELSRPNNPSAEYYKAQARAYAECLAIFMTPFLDSPDAVVRELMRRKEARDAGEEYETKGLGHRRYESAALHHASAAEGWYSTPGDGYTTDASRAGAPVRRRTGGTGARRAAPAVTIKPNDLESMKTAHEGMPEIFTAEVLANQYNYPVAAVKAALGS